MLLPPNEKENTEARAMSEPKTIAPSPKRECHKCPLNGKGDDYCWKTCLGPADGSGDKKQMSNKGISKVTLGAMPAEDEYLYNNAVGDFGSSKFSYPTETSRNSGSDQRLSAAKLDYDVERGLVKVLATFMSLSDVQLCIFRHIYNGENIASVGRTLYKPISKQAVSKHLYAMCDSDPIIRKVLKSLVRLDGTGGTRKTRDSDRRLARQAQNKSVQLKFDLFAEVIVAESGKVENPVTRTREVQHCTPTC